MASSTRGWREWGMTERMPQSGLPLVLLAGDGKEATRWLRVLLEGGGYAVLQERTGQHGLERAGTTEPDVILVDAELPDMAGVELCRMLRGDPRVSGSAPSGWDRPPRRARVRGARPRYGRGGGPPARGTPPRLGSRSDDPPRRRPAGRPHALRLRGRGERRLRADRAGGSVGAGGRGCPDRQSGFRYLAAALRRSGHSSQLPRLDQHPLATAVLVHRFAARQI